MTVAACVAVRMLAPSINLNAKKDGKLVRSD